MIDTPTTPEDDELRAAISKALFGYGIRDPKMIEKLNITEMTLAQARKYLFEACTQYAARQAETAATAARIDELKHIDDPINVRLYYHGLINVHDRIAALSSNSQEGSNE